MFLVDVFVCLFVLGWGFFFGGGGGFSFFLSFFLPFFFFFGAFELATRDHAFSD